MQQLYLAQFSHERPHADDEDEEYENDDEYYEDDEEEVNSYRKLVYQNLQPVIDLNNAIPTQSQYDNGKISFLVLLRRLF